MRIRVTDDPMGMSEVVYERPVQVHSIPLGTQQFKRAFDFVVALLILVLLAPVILLFALLVWIQDGEKPFFAQSRYGLNGKTFKCYKIRSMSVDAGAQLERLLATNESLRREWQETQKLKDDPRITPLGHLLRKSSIDELPQLWNVLKGDMSLVGPRPIVKNEIQKYGDKFSFYTAVKPGLTGLWQVEGRTNTSYRDRVNMDVRYVQTRTFWMDVWIVLRTVPAVLFSRGAV